MKRNQLTFILLLFSTILFAQTSKISIVENTEGMKLVVNGNDFMINGMNWDYYPIGTNYSYSLWKQSDNVIKAALDREMPLLKNMGVNAIRQYLGIPSKWIQYIYEKYGIYTILNHTFGRYGLTINGKWIANTEYSDPATREMLLREAKEMVTQYKDVPGVLMFVLGNENDYGLFWEGAETANIPEEDRKSTIRAKSLYQLFDDAVVEMKKIDAGRHPMAICNGDLLFLNLIAQECKHVDVLGINSYRGASFTDLYDRVKKECGKPVMLTEFGCDAFNAATNSEDQQPQADILVSNWKEIYENAAGVGKAGNSIGGFTFQFSDGWWKYAQTKNLDVHDTNASWVNGGYAFDYVKGENNMNEEWFGICAKGPTDAQGLYQLYPRAAYYALKTVHQINPYAKNSNLASMDADFSKVNTMSGMLQARGDKAALEGEKNKKIRLSEFRAEISTYNTGGNRITTPDSKSDSYTTYPRFRGFDHQESFYVGVEAKPTENVSANVVFNVLGNVAENPIDEISYENRGRTQTFTNDQGEQVKMTLDRFKVYRASLSWTGKYVNITGFMRTGHYHWGYEGDFFGLYPEANYGPNIDIYNGDAPLGAEFEGKKFLSGLKVAYGPELWWGANPAVLVKYSKEVGKFKITGIYHEDVAKRAETTSSYAIPAPKNRRVTLAIERKIGAFGIQLGGIWSGSRLVDRPFQIVKGESGNYTLYQDKIKNKDTWGGKGKITFASSAFNWYAQGAAMGLVANGGADFTRTFTGWRLKDSGSGNQYNFLSGFTFLVGDFQIAPNFLWQKPIVGPVPSDVQAPGRPRNILDDPFAVRSNRETTAGELLLAYDPTPGTWMWDWDNDMSEDAPFAASVDFVYRHQPTTQDAAIGITANGRNTFAFPGAPKARDLWETNVRLVSKINPELGLISNIYFGNAEPNGSDNRLIKRFGADLRVIYKKIKLTSMVKVNDWGPYDYHRDYNLTYPLQLMADLSTTLGKAKWFDVVDTRLGIRCTWRSLDQYSPRYAPAYKVNGAGEFVADPTALGYPKGREWEIRTYIHFSLGN